MGTGRAVGAVFYLLLITGCRVLVNHLQHTDTQTVSSGIYVAGLHAIALIENH